MAVSIENSHVPSLNLNNCNIEILVGTYEDFILGYKLTTNSEGVSFNLNFIFRQSSVIISMFSVGIEIHSQFYQPLSLWKYSSCCGFKKVSCVR